MNSGLHPHAASVLSEGTSVRGRISGQGDLEIRGRVEGDIDVAGVLTLAPGSIVEGSVQGSRIFIAGALVGDTSASDGISLGATARVVGDLRAPRVSIALGAQIRGEVDMGLAGTSSAPKRATAAGRPQAVRATVSAQSVARLPLPPARPVAVQRKLPPTVSVTATDESAVAPARKGPPPPVVPAVKKGAKAVVAKRKDG